MPADEVKEELLLGTQDAAQNGEIPELTAEDLEQLLDILAEPGSVVSVPHGDEVVVTDDGCAKLLCSGPADGGAGLPVSRQTSILAYERGFAADTVSLGHEDYSFKPVKSIKPRRCLWHADCSYYGCRHGRHSYHRRPGGMDADDPPNEACRRQTICG